MNINAVKTGLYNALTGSTSLAALASGGVFDKLAPQGVTGPYVIFQKVSGVPTFTFTARAYDTNSFLVKAVDENPSALRAGSISELIDAALTDQAITFTTGSLMVCRRSSDVDYVENADGRTYQHVGAIYTVGVQ